jgi:MFS family permease
MEVLTAVVAAVVAVTAAVRSTWSPCGLSMLSTITPLAEGGRGRNYRATTMWFVIGSTSGGACLGACMAALAACVAMWRTPTAVLSLIGVCACVIAAASDVGILIRLPVHHRQVNERWLDRFRPWVYGVGFGWQIGTGLATYIVTAGVYLLIVLGSLTADPFVALGLGAVFGIVRGLAVLLGRRITTPESLISFHRRLVGSSAVFRRVTVGVELSAAIGLAAYAWWPAALVVGAVTSCFAVRFRARRRVSVGTGTVAA